MYHGICLWRVGNQPIRARRPWLFRSKITWDTRVSVSLICAMNLNLLVCVKGSFAYDELLCERSQSHSHHSAPVFNATLKATRNCYILPLLRDHPIFETWVKPITLVGPLVVSEIVSMLDEISGLQQSELCLVCFVTSLQRKDFPLYMRYVCNWVSTLLWKLF